jgi:hypothetical protein
MKMRQALLTPVALSVLVALGGAPASAQEPATSAAMVAAPTTSANGLATSSVSAVPIKGIVSGQPESVSFSGQAQISSRLVRDPDFNKPSVLFTIDMSSVAGVGSLTKAKYVIPSGELVQRRLGATHQVDITFPFLKSGSTEGSSARSGVASFALSIDVNTGAITSGAGNVVSPSF